MGVLDPLERKASAMQDLKDEYFEMLDLTVDSLQSYGPAIVNNRYDLLEDEDPFFFLVWRDEDALEIDSMEELRREKERVQMMKEDFSIDAMKNKYAEVFSNERDVEPDYDNPVESYGDLDSLEQSLDGLIGRINSKVIEKFDLEPELVETDYNRLEYMVIETFFTLSDEIDALPLIEGVAGSKKNIEREKENILAKAVDEHREHRESVNSEYDRVEFPDEPVHWNEVIDEDDLRDFMDISDIAQVTYGDSLHMMMEEVCEALDGVEPEYPLHFRNTGREEAIDIGNRIDNTLRPDAVDDLFVYEFKHMPHDQRNYLEQNGGVEENDKHLENIEQVNMYLNELDMPAGMLVYVSSDMEVKEYVVERHSNQELDDVEEVVHDREDYDFSDYV